MCLFTVSPRDISELAEQRCHAEMRRCERRGRPLSDLSAPPLLSLSHLLFLFVAVAPSKVSGPIPHTTNTTCQINLSC